MEGSASRAHLLDSRANTLDSGQGQANAGLGQGADLWQNALEVGGNGVCSRTMPERFVCREREPPDACVAAHILQKASLCDFNQHHAPVAFIMQSNNVYDAQDVSLCSYKVAMRHRHMIFLFIARFFEE